jgi:hypothetical protein
MAWKRRAAIAGAALALAGGFAAPAAAPRHEMRFWYDDEAAARRAGAAPGPRQSTKSAPARTITPVSAISKSAMPSPLVSAWTQVSVPSSK